MKKFILLTILIVLLGPTLCAQPFNTEVQNNGNSLLIGKINNKALSNDIYGQWFLKNFEEYIPKQQILESIQNELNQYAITLFMGTWCGDSKREVPRFYKILEEIDFPMQRLTTIAVHNERDQYKQSPGGEHEGLNIHRVPTFIFYKDGKEINRIVESPKGSLEEDIAAILSKNYAPKYESVILMHTLLNEKGTDYVVNKSKKMIAQFKDKTKSIYELNTYANVLFYAGKKKEALAILTFNTLLFPKEAAVYVSLGNKYLYMKDKEKAIEFYEKSLKRSKNKEIETKILELRTSLH